MADDEKPTTIYAPDGIHRLGIQRQERVELRAGVIEWFRQFSDVAAALQLGVHCGKCGKDVTGANSDTDQVYAVSCDCREFVGQNRDWRGLGRVPLH